MIDDRDHLPLHEEILLLSLRDEKGTVPLETMYRHAIAGAILAELVLRGRVTIEDPDGKQLGKVTNERRTGMPLVDECLERMAGDKHRPMKYWVAKFAAIKGLKHRVAERLCERGILREEEGKVLIVFSRRVYPETDPRPEHEIVERMRRAIFTDTRDIDPRTIVLISLAKATKVLKLLFDRKDLGQRKERLEQLISGEAVGKAARDAVQAAQVAVMVAAIMPAVIASTTSN